jgi:hypothetical protein
MASPATTPVRSDHQATPPSGVMPVSHGNGAPQSGAPQPGAIPAVLPPQQGGPAAGNGTGKSIHHSGRSKLDWSSQVWERIDKAVETEIKRVFTGSRFLPVKVVSPKTLTVPSDSYTLGPNGGYSAAEGATTPVITLQVPFSMTAQQIAQESSDDKELGHSTAVTLAVKAANSIALATDLIISQGQNALNNPLFRNNIVSNNSRPADTGLLNFAVGSVLPPAGTAIQVNPVKGGYGTATFAAVTQAIAQQTAIGNCGPFAAILDTYPYGDAYRPISDLAVPADSIRPLMNAGFFGSSGLQVYPAGGGALAQPPYFGFVISMGGDSADLVMGLHPTVAVMQELPNGDFQLLVTSRIALRLKNPQAVTVLQFN